MNVNENLKHDNQMVLFCIEIHNRRRWYWLKLITIVTIMMCLIATINSKWNEEKKSVITIRSLSNEIEQCAFLECSHSSRCTTQNQTCCAYILKHALVFLDTFFRRHQMPYVIIYGTLLGAMRNNTIIPWTRDIDIGFFNRTYLETKKIRDELYQHGFHLFKNLNLMRLCVHRNISNTTLLLTQNLQHKPPASIVDLHAYVDLYLATRKNETYKKSNTSMFAIELSGRFLSPISFQKNAMIDGQIYPTVDNIKEHLIHFYKQNYTRDIIPVRP